MVNKTTPGSAGVARRCWKLYFGNLAIILEFTSSRPMVLRLRLSPDLPLSEEKLKFYVTKYIIGWKGKSFIYLLAFLYYFHI
jgi:hypothetical protein